MLSRLDMTRDQKPSFHFPDSFAQLLIVLLRVHDVDLLDELLVTSVSQPCRGVSLVSLHLVEYEDFFRKINLRAFNWLWRVGHFCMP